MYRTILAMLLGCSLVASAIAETNAADTISVAQLVQDAAQLDGRRIRVEGFLDYTQHATTRPHSYFTLFGTQQVETADGGKSTRCSLDFERSYFIASPRRFGHSWKKLQYRRVVISGVFKNEVAMSYFHPLTIEMPGSFSDVRLEKVFDDHCDPPARQ